MPPKRVEFTVSEEFLVRVDEARGHEPRASFVKRVLESALSVGSLPSQNEADVRAARASTSASSRASDVEPHAGNEDTLATPGCPECGSNMGRTDGRWVCPDCGFVS